MNKDQNPWYYIKDVLRFTSKEVFNGFEDIANMIIGKDKNSNKSNNK